MTDLRTRRTLAAIDRSMYQLMAAHDFATISVTMICQAANITRSTYYQYYLDKNDWLERICGYYRLVAEQTGFALDDLTPLVAQLAPDAAKVLTLLNVHEAAGDLHAQLTTLFATRFEQPGYLATVYAASAVATLQWQLQHPKDHQAPQAFAALVKQLKKASSTF